MWKEIYSDKYKRVVMDTETGEKRTIVLDQKYREAENRGDLLQPVGKDKKRFFDKYPHLKENYKGEIVDTDKEWDKIKKDVEDAKEEEKEEFEKRDKIHKKYY